MALSFARPKQNDKDIIKKSKSTVSRTSIKGGTNIATQIQAIVSMAEAKLAHHKDDYLIIRTVEELRAYVNECRYNNECALDTETTGLDPLKVDIVGVCLYTPNNKACYIPINHKSYVTGVRTNNQLTEDQVANELRFLIDDKIKIIMHNAKYDIRVCRHTLGLDFSCYWDTQLAANCIDENESHRLKDLHLKYCDSTDTESLTFDSLFGGITFDNVPINVAYLYASGDAIKTYELYQYQKTLLNRRVLAGPYNVFTNIEMPVLKVVCDMEDRGVCLDLGVCEALHSKYTKIKEEAYNKASTALKLYSEEVDKWRMKHPNESGKLSDPISITSPTQLAILFYDILKLEPVDKKSPRGTGEDILKEFAKGKHKDICEAILEVRGVEKLLGTYIDKMPEIAHKDGRIHCSYNQYGAKTGRFSSNDPNMQNIPSHNGDIRQMFKAQDGYVLVGGDFSQQEPKLTAHLSKDKTMLKAFLEGKDIYATIAGISFNKPYEECLEFRPDGTTNKEGKERRSQAKSIVLGILYGRQIPSIAEQLGVSTKKAQEIYDKVLKAFPALKKFMDESQTMARDLGYVDTAWGRRRHLPDMQLQPYEFSLNGKMQASFDPLNFGAEVATEVDPKEKTRLTKLLNECRGWQQKNTVIEQANQNGIKIKDNGGFIAQAERQCVNARVQGSAADLTKIAMIKIGDDEELKQLDFHLLIQVHDEVIGECPKENMKAVKERLEYIMVHCADDMMQVPMKCDIAITNNWYGKEVE